MRVFHTYSRHFENQLQQTLAFKVAQKMNETLNYKPPGRRDRGRPRKQWQRVNAGTGQTT
jgi:ectoine hydroxylase-related dioxygenase (phytanoyl-CoA dioxygenase family)